MTYGIDFDGCWSEDPLFFLDLVDLIEGHGHRAVLITQRTERHSAEVYRALNNRIPVVFAGGKTKADAAIEAGYDIDVWIDDEPIGVYVARTYVGS